MQMDKQSQMSRKDWSLSNWMAEQVWNMAVCFIRSREELLSYTCVTELAKRRRQVGVKVDRDFIALRPTLLKNQN